MSVMTISGSFKGFNTIKVLVMFVVCYVSFIIVLLIIAIVFFNQLPSALNLLIMFYRFCSFGLIIISHLRAWKDFY